MPQTEVTPLLGKGDDTSSFFRELSKKQPTLFRAQMEVTSRCNERCVHCFMPPDRQQHDLDTEVALRVLDEMAQMKTVSLIFTGGEPFLHPGFERLLRRARKNDLNITILTNGTCISDRDMEVLDDVVPHEVRVSLYSMRAEEHEAITQIEGSHARTLAAIDRLIAANIPVNIGCPLMKTNRYCYEDIQACSWHDAHLTVAYQCAKNNPSRTSAIARVVSRSANTWAPAVSLAMQTLHQAALEAVGRKNISLSALRELQGLLQRDGIASFTCLILGLPEETYDSFADGLSELASEDEDRVINVYGCNVLPNAAMGDPEYQRRHGITTASAPMVHDYQSLEQTRGDKNLERCQVIVATRSMPRGDWVRARVLAWTYELLHLADLASLPLCLISRRCKVGFRRLLESFMDADPNLYPTCAELVERLSDHAREMQNGAPEQMPADGWNDAWLPTHQHMFIWLVKEERLDPFYVELASLLGGLLDRAQASSSGELIRESVVLNQMLLALPFQYEDATVTCSHNIYEYHRGLIRGEPVPLERGPHEYLIDRTSAVWVDWRDWFDDLAFRFYARRDSLSARPNWRPVEVLDAVHPLGRDVRHPV